MSAATDRLDELEAQTAPLPWPVYDFYDLPDDQFQMLFSLSQAWPVLRQEIKDLEAAVLSLSKENAQLHSEHRRLAAGATQLGRELGELRGRHDRVVAESNDSHRVIEAENDRLNALVSKLPIATAAAFAVCLSLTTPRKGSGGAYGWYDGEALDAWRRAKAGEG